jgi:hypothetical protein
VGISCLCFKNILRGIRQSWVGNLKMKIPEVMTSLVPK